MLNKMTVQFWGACCLVEEESQRIIVQGRAIRSIYSGSPQCNAQMRNVRLPRTQLPDSSRALRKGRRPGLSECPSDVQSLSPLPFLAAA